MTFISVLNMSANFVRFYWQLLVNATKVPAQAYPILILSIISFQAISCNSNIFSELIAYLVNELQLSDGSDEYVARMRRTHVQCICAITRQAGHKIGKFHHQLMPIITTFCKQDEVSYCSIIWLLLLYYLVIAA